MYSSSDIEKYLNGELSAPEMHALERAALDDPFLADALDGMRIHRHLPERPPFHEDVAQLQQRLQNRVAAGARPARIRPLFVRYAAAMILLVGLGVTAYYMFLDRGVSKVSALQHHEPDSTPAAPPPVAENATPPADTQLSQASQASRDIASRPALSSTRKKDEEISLKKTVTDKSAGVGSRVLTDSQTYTISPSQQAALDAIKAHRDSTSLANNYNFRTYAPARAQSVQTWKAADSHAKEYKASGPADKLVFSGKVTDPHNNPLPGAYIALRNNQSVNAMTDRNGNFRLSNNFDTSSAVVVNHIGFEQGSIYLNTENSKGNFIQLQPQSASLNEVVIEGYGAKRREIMRQNIDAEHKALSLVAVPADGWPAYKDYLESNKRTAGLDSNLRGDEAISFIVNKKGEFSSFKVEQSISPAHDSTVIRLIRQGPAWKLLSGKRTRARVILTY